MAAGEVVLQSADSLGAEGLPEAGLIDSCRAGDPAAFTRLVALHEGMVFNLASRLLGDTEEARDLSQDVFLQVYRTLDRFEGRSSFRTWVYRIVINQCYNRHRWWRRRRKSSMRPLDTLTPRDEVHLQPAQPVVGPFEQVERLEASRRVQAALDGLSFDHRSILVLREVEGLSCEEIASTLGLPIGTVKSRLARGREALRLRLLPCLEAKEIS